MLDAMLKALTEQFPDDPWAPNVLLSYLPEGRIYGSIGRYEAADHASRQVLYKCTGATVDLVLMQLATQLGIPNG